MESYERIEDCHVPGCRCVPCIKERNEHSEEMRKQRHHSELAIRVCEMLLKTPRYLAEDVWFDLQCKASEALRGLK